MKQRVLKVHEADNVLVALQNLQKGETIQYRGKEYVPAADINAKHKFLEHAARR
jgi:altronate hydrolase